MATYCRVVRRDNGRVCGGHMDMRAALTFLQKLEDTDFYTGQYEPDTYRIERYEEVENDCSM